MNTQEHDGDLAQQFKPMVMTLRTIVLAMASGVLMFAAVAIFVRSRGNIPPAAGSVDILTLLGIALTPVALIASWIVPGIVAKSARRALAAGEGRPSPGSLREPPSPARGEGLQRQLPNAEKAAALGAVYQTKTIIGVALLEGVAFLNLITYMLQGSLVGLGLGIALAAAIVVLNFPSAPRAAGWVDEQLRLMDEEKLLVR